MLPVLERKHAKPTNQRGIFLRKKYMKVVENNTVQTHVVAVNKAFRSARASSRKLFDAIYTARVELTDASDWNEFVASVECDRSTINKTVKIAECEWIRENAMKLPVAWSVLNVIATIARKDDEQLKRLLEDGELNTRTTLAELKALLAPSTPSVSTEPEVRVNTEFFSPEQIEFFREVEPEFKALGIKVTDTAKKSEETEAANDPVASEELQEAA